MSLYGLDIIVDNDGKYNLIEINGVNSGMEGFRRIYGDNRVREKVFDMIDKKYENVTVNDGTYREKIVKKKHPYVYPVVKTIAKSGYGIIKKYKELIDGEEIEKIEFPFDSYEGQDSTVLDLLNEDIPVDKVNPFHKEEITRNKLLQYILLKDTEIYENLPDTTSVGLGSTKEDELEEMLNKYDKFVIKPIKGNRGRGIKIIDNEEASSYRGTSGPADPVSKYDIMRFTFKKYTEMLNENPDIELDPNELEKKIEKYFEDNKKYIEDFIAEEDFSFEKNLKVLQQYIESPKDKYASVRAIVCNDEYIDSYTRVDDNEIVNLANGAKAKELKDENIGDFCEKVIETFNEESDKYDKDNFKKNLYSRYFNRNFR